MTWRPTSRKRRGARRQWITVTPARGLRLTWRAPPPPTPSKPPLPVRQRRRGAVFQIFAVRPSCARRAKPTGHRPAVDCARPAWIASPRFRGTALAPVGDSLSLPASRIRHVRRIDNTARCYMYLYGVFFFFSSDNVSAPKKHFLCITPITFSLRFWTDLDYGSKLCNGIDPNSKRPRKPFKVQKTETLIRPEYILRPPL